MMNTGNFDVFITTARGLENVTARETAEITGTEPKETIAGVSTELNLEQLYRLCLGGRSINRILAVIARFSFATPKDIYSVCRRIPWDEHFSVSAAFAVDCTVTRNREIQPNFGVFQLKDAIADYFRDSVGKRPDVDTRAPKIRFNLHVDGSEAAVALDFSGGSLHQRGYRIESGEAGLKETLAAAILLKSGWHGLVQRHPGAALVDPMCGTGAFCIEGALIGSGTPPGMIRNRFGFEDWKLHDPKLYRNIFAELQSSAGKPTPVFGYDRDKRAIASAWRNAERAGMRTGVHFQKQELYELTRPAGAGETGLVVINPPYGKRLEEREYLPALYQHIGRLLKQEFSGWHASVLVPEDELGRALGLKAFKVSSLFNGELPCKLVQIALDGGNAFHIYFPPVVRRNSGDTEAREHEYRDNTKDLENRLKKNLRQRSTYLRRNNISCYRLYDADIPEYSAAVDVYEHRWLHIQEYSPPVEIDAVKAQRRLLDIVSTAGNVTGIPAEHIFVKRRNRQRGTGQYGKIGDTGAFSVVHEGGLKFLANFSDYLDTGIFLDHRITRDTIRRKAAGKDFLNLFCYTGTATAYAADGGALSSVSVDASDRYLEWARRNLQLNGIDRSSHTLVQEDCINWIKGCSRRFDLIFIDPPTYSNSKSRRTDFSVERDHPELLLSAARLLTPGGSIIFSTNFRKFVLDEALSSRFCVQEITEETIPPDFERSRKIHRCWEVRTAAAEA